MFQSLRMRTRYHRNQKIRDCYVAFILHNLKLESDSAYAPEWREAPVELEVLDAIPDTDATGKQKGESFRKSLIEQMWRDRAERKQAARK
jgi:hypothetical protein